MIISKQREKYIGTLTLLRLPPQPSSLPRASLVCKRWRSIATDTAFGRRLRTHHRKPPIVDIFEELPRELKFTPLLDPPDRIPSEHFSLDLSADEISSWTVLRCRHGRVLLINRERHLLLMFESVSGDTLQIPIPPEFVGDTDTEVLRAACNDQDHLHRDCHMSSFNVVLVSSGSKEGSAIASVYSQETGMWMWGDLVSTVEPCASYFGLQRSTLVGNALYWCMYASGDIGEDCILKFDLDNQALTVISGLPADPVGSDIHIIRAEDGSLGLAVLSYPTFQLWDRMVDCHGVAKWLQQKDINMDKMLGPKADSAQLLGYAEDADVIFLSVYQDSDSHGLTIVQLESVMVKECHGDFCADFYHLLANFYTAGTARA